MATVPTEPAALENLDYLIDDVIAEAYVRGAEGRTTETSPRSAKTLSDAIAATLAAVRAKGKAEGEVAGMFKAAGIAREAGDIANMLWNDNVDADNNLVRRDEAFDIANQIILAIIPASAESTVPEQGERETEAATLRTLVALIMQMSRYLPAGNEWRGKSMDYLKRKGLLPSPFRAGARLRAPDGGRETVAAADERAVERKAIELATAANMIWEELEDYGSGGENRTTYRKLAVSRLRAPDGEGV